MKKTQERPARAAGGGVSGARLMNLAVPVLSDPSTESMLLPLHFLLRRRPFFVGAAVSSSVESVSTPASSSGYFLPSSARAHLSART